MTNREVLKTPKDLLGAVDEAVHQLASVRRYRLGAW